MKSEVRSQKSEVEAFSLKSEVRSQKSEVGAFSLKSEVEALYHVRIRTI